MINKEEIYKELKGLPFKTFEQLFKYLYENKININFAKILNRTSYEKFLDDSKETMIDIEIELRDSDDEEESFEKEYEDDTSKWLYNFINKNTRIEDNISDNIFRISIKNTDIDSKTITIAVMSHIVRYKSKHALSENLRDYYNNLINDISDALEEYDMDFDVLSYHNDMVNIIENNEVKNIEQLKSIFKDRAKNGLYGYNKAKKNLMLKVINEY